MRGFARGVATVGGVGLLRPAPGTWGSAAALPMAYGVHELAGFPGLMIATIFVTVLGIWATAVSTSDQDDHDPSEIVIDEVAGQFIALMPLSYPAWSMGIDITVLWPGWIAAFILFRLFDIAKPGPVGWADRRHDAVGVMLDDIIAGILAALCVIALAGFYHGVLAS